MKKLFKCFSSTDDVAAALSTGYPSRSISPAAIHESSMSAQALIGCTGIHLAYTMQCVSMAAKSARIKAWKYVIQKIWLYVFYFCLLIWIMSYFPLGTG
jgi:hypothetical protein